MKNKFEIKKERIIDKSEIDSEGMYEYYYEYDKYTFIFEGVTYIVRRYMEDDNKAKLLSKIIEGRIHTIDKEDYNNDCFIEISKYLMKCEGVILYTI